MNILQRALPNLELVGKPLAYQMLSLRIRTLYASNKTIGKLEGFERSKDTRISNAFNANFQSREFFTAPVIAIKASELTKDNLTIANGCPVCSRGITFTYRDVLFLSQFMTPEGHMINRRKTGVCKKQHLKIQKCMHIARRVGLLPRIIPKDGDEDGPISGQKSKSMLKRTRYTKF